MIELVDYDIPADRPGNGLRGHNLNLSRGDACAVRTDSHADACLLLRALATLLPPRRGLYRFRGEALDFSDYRELLPVKKRIGYIGTDAAMISNYTIRDNLLLMRQYHENSLEIEIDDGMTDLIRLFGFDGQLEDKPGGLAPPTLKLAIVVREFCKSPDLLLLEYPEDYIAQAKLEVFSEALSRMPLSRMVLVFASDHDAFVEQFANTHVSISQGVLVRR